MPTRPRTATVGALAGAAAVLLALAGCTGSSTPPPVYASPTASSSTLGITLSASQAKDALAPADALGSGWQMTTDTAGSTELTSELGAVSFQPQECDLSTGLEAVFPSDGLAQRAGEVFTGTGIELPKYGSVDVRSYDRALTAADLAGITEFVQRCPTVSLSAFGQSVSAHLATEHPATTYGDETVAVRIEFGGSGSTTSSGPLSGTVDLTAVRVGHTIVSALSVGVGGAQTAAGAQLLAGAMSQLQHVTTS